MGPSESMARACAVDKRPARVTKLRMRRSFGSYSMCLSVSEGVFSGMKNKNKNSAKNTAKHRGEKEIKCSEFKRLFFFPVTASHFP